MVIRISDKTQNYSKVTKLLVKPNTNKNDRLNILKQLYIGNFKKIKQNY